MAVALVALDYSRPIQPVFEQASRTGTVHSVFRKALNIVAGDSMLTVLSSELSRMPNSARMPAVVMDRLYRNLHSGVQVLIGDGKLLIPAIDFSLRLPQELAWEPRPEITTHHWQRASLAHNTHLLAQHLAQKARQDGLAPLVAPLLLRRPARETPLTQRALPLLQLLVRACRLEDSAGVEEAARGLAGLGPGLTPSGDDALAGFVSVLTLLSAQLCADALPREHLASIIASTAQPCTTKLSATLLAHAARGELAEQLGTLLTALALPVEESQTLLHAADRVLAYGAYSGGDTLLGILLGLQALGIENTLHESGEYHGHTGVAQAKYLL